MGTVSLLMAYQAGHITFETTEEAVGCVVLTDAALLFGTAAAATLIKIDRVIFDGNDTDDPNAVAAFAENST